MTTIDPDQPGTWIESIFESLAGQVERWVSRWEHVPESNDSGDWPDDVVSSIRNWRWE